MASGLWSAVRSAFICSAMTNHKDDKLEPGRRKVIAAGVGLAGGLIGAAAGVSLGGARSNPAPRRLGVRRFEDKVVCITGATSGIGRAAALAFAAEGAKVGFCGRREELGRALEQQIRADGGEASYIRA